MCGNIKDKYMLSIIVKIWLNEQDIYEPTGVNILTEDTNDDYGIPLADLLEKHFGLSPCCHPSKGITKKLIITIKEATEQE